MSSRPRHQILPHSVISPGRFKPFHPIRPLFRPSSIPKSDAHTYSRQLSSRLTERPLVVLSQRKPRSYCHSTEVYRVVLIPDRPPHPPANDNLHRKSRSTFRVVTEGNESWGSNSVSSLISDGELSWREGGKRAGRPHPVLKVAAKHLKKIVREEYWGKGPTKPPKNSSVAIST